jgi:hypothetical protein
MAKLRLHHVGQLMRYAYQNGYVLVTPGGVFYPGFQRRIRALEVAKGASAKQTT